MYRKTVFIFFALLFISNIKAQDENQYELQTITFNGNEEISSSVLSSVIYSEETPAWFWKFLNSFTPFGAEPVYFDSSDIEQDIEALRAYYKANGFFQSSFSYNYNTDSSSKEVELIYNIYEGEFTRYGKINFVALDSVPYGIYEDIESDLSLDSSDRYDQQAVQENITNSVNILQNSGYPYAKFDSTIVNIDTLNNYADLNIHIYSGELYLIDTVLVKLSGDGSAEVNEDALRNITGIVKDEPYSRAEIRSGQSRLFRTGLFNSINLSAVDTTIDGNRIPVLLEGTINYLNELSPELILNNQQNALNAGAGINYIRKNFLGRARRLTLKGSFGIQDIFNLDFGNLLKRFSFRDTTLLGYLDTRATIEQAYLFNEPIFGTLENYFTVEKQRNFNITRFGSLLTFDFELPHYTFVNTFSTFYNIEQTNELYYRNRDSLSKKLLSVIGFNTAKTSADDILFPTEGYNITFLIEEANSLPYLFAKITGSDYTGTLFYRLILSSAYYYSLDQERKAIFASKLKIGHMQPYLGDYAGLPINRTFYAGGSNSVRGWRSYDLVPQGTPGIVGFTGVNVKGGTFLAEGSTELRYRFLENIGTTLFVDYGNVWLNYLDFRYDEVAIAAGIGFRYYTEVAPFRLDFGFKFYDPFDKKFIWKNWKPGFFNNLEFHFGIGEAF